MRWIILVIIFNISTISLSGQRLGLDLLQGREKVTVPFDYVGGFIVLDLKISLGLELKFVFDTGAENTILFKKEIADLLGFQYTNRVEIIGSDLTVSQYALVTRAVRFKLKNSQPVVRDILVLEATETNFNESLGIQFDGILGGSFFRGLVLHIDYKNEELIFYDPNKFDPSKLKDFERFPLQIVRNKPYLNTEVALTNDTILNPIVLIDTGASLGFLIHSNSDSLLRLPKNVIPGNLGLGLGGHIKGYLGKIEKLKIGSFEFNQLVSSFQDVDSTVLLLSTIRRNGIIGNYILDRFEIIIDYLNGVLYLKPNKNYNREFEYDKSGLLIYASGPNLNYFYVKDVLPNSPGEKAGFKTGDRIKKIGWWNRRFWTLRRINKLLTGKVGKKIKFVIYRQGIKHKKILILEDLLKDIK